MVWSYVQRFGTETTKPAGGAPKKPKKKKAKAGAAFMGVFGQCTNGLSFFFSLVGTSFVIRRFGLKTTIMAFPSLCFIAMVLVYMFPTLPMVFVMMLVLKALSYA